MIAVVCCFLFIITFFGTIILLRSKSSDIRNAAVSETAVLAAESLSTNEETYILKEYNGSICIFHGAFQDIPAIITDIQIDALTTKDRELLFQGIEVYGREALLKLLEDFSS